MAGGSYKLTGGTGQDILIAGTTSYDTNLAALDAILAYWGRTDLTYAQEVTGLSTTGVTYQDATGTHTAVLNTSTVFDNGMVDTLAGDRASIRFSPAKRETIRMCSRVAQGGSHHGHLIGTRWGSCGYAASGTR